MQKEVAITTEDNPFDPFTEFDSWLSYDVQMGYSTCERLAAIDDSCPHSLTDDENNYFVEEAINELLKRGCIGKNGQFVEYRKVYMEKNPDKS